MALKQNFLFIDILKLCLHYSETCSEMMGCSYLALVQRPRLLIQHLSIMSGGGGEAMAGGGTGRRDVVLISSREGADDPLLIRAFFISHLPTLYPSRPHIPVYDPPQHTRSGTESHLQLRKTN